VASVTVLVHEATKGQDVIVNYKILIENLRIY